MVASGMYGLRPLLMMNLTTESPRQPWWHRICVFQGAQFARQRQKAPSIGKPPKMLGAMGHYVVAEHPVQQDPHPLSRAACQPLRVSEKLGAK